MVDYERMLKILETQEKSQAEGQKEADTKRLFLEEPSSMADIAMQRRTIDLPPRLHSQRIQSKPMTDMRWSDINMNGTNNQPPAAISFRKTNTGGNNDGAIAPSSSSLSENTLSKHKSNSGEKELQKQDGEKSANIAAKAVKLVAASNQEYEDQNLVVFNADNRDVFERCRSDMSRDLWSKDPFEEETFPADEIKEGEGNDVIVKDVVITPAVRVLPLATEEVDKKPPQEEEEVVVEENKTQEVEVPMEDSMKILPEEQQDATKVSKEQEVSTKNSVVAKPRGFGILKRKARMSNLRKKKKNDASKKTAPSNVAPSTTTNEDEKKGENKALNLRQRVRIRMLGVNSRQSKKTVVEKSATVVKADDASTKITDELKKQEPVQEVPSTPVKKQLSNDNPATPPSSSTLAAVIIANPSRGKELTFDNVKDGSNPVDTPTTTTSNVSTLNTPSSHAVSTATPNSEEVPSGFTPKTAAEEAVELEASPMLLPPAMPSAVTVKKEEEEEETAEESMPDDTTIEEEEEPQGEDEQEDEAKAVDSMEELKETEKTITEDGQDADTITTEMLHNDGEDDESTSINRIVCNNDEHGVIDSSTDVLVDVSSAFQGEGDDIEVIKCMDIKDIESDILSVRESVRGNRDNNVNDNIPEEEEEEEEDDDEDIFEDLSSKNETSNATSNEETVPSLPSKENNEPTKSQSRGGRIVGRRIMKLKKNLVSAEAKSKNRQGSKNKGRRFSLKDKETSGVTADTAHLSSDAKDVVDSSPESANAMLLKEVIGKNKTACGLSPEAQAVLAGDDLAIDGIEVGSDKKQTGLSQKAKFILAAAETNEDMEEIEVLMESKRHRNKITVSKKQKKQTQIRRSNTDKSYDSSYANSYESQDDDESLYNDSEEEEDGSFYGSEADDDDDDSTCSFVSKASTRSDRSSNVFNFEPCGIPQEELVEDLIDAFQDTKAHVQQIIEGLDFRDIANCTEVPVSKRENRRARRRRAAAALSENSKRKQRSSREISTDRRRSSSRVERKNGEMKTRRMEV